VLVDYPFGIASVSVHDPFSLHAHDIFTFVITTCM